MYVIWKVDKHYYLEQKIKNALNDMFVIFRYFYVKIFRLSKNIFL